MNRKSPRRRAVIVLIGLAVIAVVIWAAIRLVDGQISYTDEAVDIELIPPATPAPPPPAPAAN